MCLVKSDNIYRKDRLTVYKVLLETPNGLITPYMRVPVQLGEILRSRVPYSEKSYTCKVIFEEGVHACINLESAIKECEEWFSLYSHLNVSYIIPVIYEAIIPDVEYWLGTVGDVAATELLITSKRIYYTANVS